MKLPISFTSHNRAIRLSGRVGTALALTWLGLGPVSAYGFQVDPNNIVPGTVANKLIANGNGADWLSAALLVNLSAGSVYNDPNYDTMNPQQNLWGFVPELEFDSWVGIPGDGTGAITGAASDLGDSPGPAVIAGQKVSVTWYNTAATNTGPARIANMTFTDDAQGLFSLRASFSGPTPIVLLEQGWIEDGVAYFGFQGDLDKDGFVGLDDLDIVLQNWNRAVPPGDLRADASHDGFVGLDDLDRVLANWNNGTPASKTVPEPASAILSVMAIGVYSLRRER